METKLDETARSLKADMLKSQSDVLDLAARLEMGATNAYLSVIPPSRTRSSPRWPADWLRTRPCTGPC